jgi:hypothetical protein
MANEWRNHPNIAGRLTRQYPDDLQVVVHDGGPRMTDRRPEVVWVRVVGNHGDVFSAKLLNQPNQLCSVKLGDSIEFVVPVTGKYPIQVRPKYMKERSAWIVAACEKCGLSELFDSPSDLIAKVFPNLPPDAGMESFTAICGMCGGVQVVRRRSAKIDVI